MLRKSVVMFMIRNRKSFTPIGSGTFVFHREKLLIVSAAHVFDDHAGSTIYMHVLDTIFRFSSLKIHLSNNKVFSNDRQKDPLDLAMFEVPENVLDYCNGKISFVQNDMIENNLNQEHVIFYQAIGFPIIKNTKLSNSAVRKNGDFTPSIIVYSGHNASSRMTEENRFTSNYHVAMVYEDKKNVDDDGTRVNIPDLHGLSGGLIQGCFDYTPKSNGLYPTCAAGILIEKNSSAKALIGVKFSTVYEWLDNHFL